MLLSASGELSLRVTGHSEASYCCTMESVTTAAATEYEYYEIDSKHFAKSKYVHATKYITSHDKEKAKMRAESKKTRRRSEDIRNGYKKMARILFELEKQ